MLVSCFKGKLKHVKRKLKLSQQRVMLNSPVLNPSPFDQSNAHSNLSSQSVLDGSLSQRNSVKVNLPKIQLPCFDGNIQQWTEFWKMFYYICGSTKFVQGVKSLLISRVF